MKKILAYLFEHKTLSEAEAKDIMLQIGAGVFTDSELSAFVTVFLMRSVTINELQGFRAALLEMALVVNLENNDVIDIVGTGGDGKNTFNISTLSCFIVAGVGQRVAKHGNYGLSSISGSSNVLEALGYKFLNSSEALNNELDKAGICFLHAPLFHPALKNVAVVRKSLGMRTFFNMLGPIVNPASPKYQLIGVYNLEMARIYNYILQGSDTKFNIIHSLDGYDEISLTSDTKIISNEGEKILSAEKLGKRLVNPADIYGGNSVQEAAEKFLTILKGKGTWAQNAVVLANAATALNVTEKYGTYNDCYELAVESLESGKAYEVFKKLIETK